MIISIASGKGGTGKTTVAVNLAASLEGDVQILDCDVEEPNVHLFLNPEIEESNPAHTMIPIIDHDRCSLCGNCADVCRFSAIAVVGETLLTFPQLCHSCRGCLLGCPEQAIKPGERELGVIERGQRNDLDVIQGRMRIGEAMAPPLVKKVKSEITENQITIIDAPPGTSCPVMTAIKNTDFVVLVTEPTPFGLHDLKLAVEAVKMLAIPHGIIINRSDIGDNKVNEFADQEKIPILMDIPFSREIAETYSKGHLLVEDCPEWKAPFQQLFKDIEKIVS
jgi:MinD superfamily P-loop ATPase